MTDFEICEDEYLKATGKKREELNKEDIKFISEMHKKICMHHWRPFTPIPGKYKCDHCAKLSDEPMIEPVTMRAQIEVLKRRIARDAVVTCSQV